MAGIGALLAATLSAAFFAGAMPALVAGLGSSLAQPFQVNEKRIGILAATLRLAMIPALFLSGVIVDRVGFQVVLVVGSMLGALGLTALAVSRSLVQATAACVLLGLAAAGLTIGSLMLMPRAFAPYDSSAALNLGAAFFTLGALLCPPLVCRAVGRWGVRQALLVLALLALLPGVTGALSPGAAAPPADDKIAEVFDSLVLWLIGLFLFLYWPVETTLARVGTRFLTDLGHTPGRVSLYAGGFWLAYVLARLGAAVALGERVFLPDAEMWLTLALTLAASIAIGNMAGTDGSTSGALGLLVVGVGLGPLVPTALGKVFALFPEARGTAAGTLCAIGLLGDALLAPPLARIARRAGVRLALRLALVLTLVMAALALLLALVG